eukprot:8132974-Pyramimonas_sp.AAC.1
MPWGMLVPSAEPHVERSCCTNPTKPVLIAPLRSQELPLRAGIRVGSPFDVNYGSPPPLTLQCFGMSNPPPREATDTVWFDYYLFKEMDPSMEWSMQLYAIVDDPIHI